MRLLLILLKIIAVYSEYEYYPKVGNTLILNDANIENAIVEYENLIIMFYNGYIINYYFKEKVKNLICHHKNLNP